jgi:hypothetical protein
MKIVLLNRSEYDKLLGLQTYVSIHNLFISIGSAQDFAPGVNQHGIAVALVSSSLGARRGNSSNKALRVDGTAPNQQFPVQRASRHVEGARIEQHAAAWSLKN